MHRQRIIQIAVDPAVPVILRPFHLRHRHRLLLVARTGPGAHLAADVVLSLRARFAAWLIVFAVLWIAHARGMTYRRRASARPRPLRADHYAGARRGRDDRGAGGRGWLDRGALLRRSRARRSASEWHDPVFDRPLGFYFFDLPFYSMLIKFLAACALGGALAYYLAARGWQIRREFPGFGSATEIDLRDLRALGRSNPACSKGSPPFSWCCSPRTSGWAATICC